MTSSIVYRGQLRTEATHIQSGTIIETDAPTDNRGKGERFSPTDLLCVSLGTCMVTTMALKGTDMNIELSGTTLEVTKHIASDPRRVIKIEVVLTFPSTLKVDDKDKLILERTGNNCPVAKTLHPDVEQVIKYVWS